MNEIECETCIKRKTKYCPSSSKCYENIDKPYYQNRIMLLEENKQLKGSLQTYEILLKANVEENQQLKKQLENCYCNRTDCSARIKDSKQYDSLVQKVENQQKEFIEWLESESKELIRDAGYHQRICLDILEKYKEIIGVSNENNIS